MDEIFAHGDTPWTQHYSTFGAIAMIAIALFIVGLTIYMIKKDG